MRLAIVKILQQQLQDFLTVAGIEMQGMNHLLTFRLQMPDYINRDSAFILIFLH